MAEERQTDTYVSWPFPQRKFKEETMCEACGGSTHLCHYLTAEGWRGCVRDQGATITITIQWCLQERERVVNQYSLMCHNVCIYAGFIFVASPFLNDNKYIMTGGSKISLNQKKNWPVFPSIEPLTLSCLCCWVRQEGGKRHDMWFFTKGGSKGDRFVKLFVTPYELWLDECKYMRHILHPKLIVFTYVL